jgi:hypothetical protein
VGRRLPSLSPLGTLAARSALAIPTCPTGEGARERLRMRQRQQEPYWQVSKIADDIVTTESDAISEMVHSRSSMVAAVGSFRIAIGVTARHTWSCWLAGGGRSDHHNADRAGAIGVILGAAAQTLLVYSLIFCAMPAVGLGLLCGRCRSVPRTTGKFRSPTAMGRVRPWPARCCSRPCGRMRSRSPAPSPVGQVGIARADRAARVPRGDRDGNRRPTKMGLLFPPDHPRLACCNDFKDASKAAAPSSTDIAGVAIPKNKNADRVMTPSRWNWSANTRYSLKSGGISDLAQFALSRSR